MNIKFIAIPAIALAAGISLAACSSAKAPAPRPTVTHTMTPPPATHAPAATTAPRAVPRTPAVTHTAIAAPPVHHAAPPVHHTPAPVVTHAAPAPTHAALPLLVVRVGEGYSGVRPSSIALSGDATYQITGITWSSWGPNTATGTGTSGVLDCNPSCAAGSDTPTRTTIVLSGVQNGQFTQLSATRDGTTTPAPASQVFGAS